MTHATVVGLCLALSFGMVSAADREIDYTGQQSKQRLTSGPQQYGSDDAVDIQQTFGDQFAVSSLQSRLNSAPGLDKASALVAAATTQTGEEAISNLMRALSMDLPDTPEGDKIRSEAYRLLGLNYGDAPSKQAGLFTVAMQYTADSSRRAWLQQRIAQAGGDVVDLMFRPDGVQYDTRDFGVADTCDAAIAVSLGDNFGPFSIDFGDHDWFVFDINEADGGAQIEIETFSDMPGTFTDDTDLTLYDGCDLGTGTPGTEIAFSEDFNEFLSLISTDCLANGTYYAEVGGFFDVSAPDNINVDFRTVASCVPPQPDAFEPDNDRDNASMIGRLVSGNPFGLFKGTIQKEIQAHNFFPSPDVDYVKFFNLRNELVRIETSCQFPTIFNDFAFCDEDEDGLEDDPGDTQIVLLTNTEETYGGRCNDQSTGFVDNCDVDLDCDFNMNGDPFDDLVDPVPGFPACIPIQNFGGVPFADENPLAFDDDGGTGFASLLTLCLPSGIKPISPSLMVQNDPSPELEYEWFVRVQPFSATDTFDYEIFVHNETTCIFEQEPNNDFVDATPLPTDGSSIHGIFDYSETRPLQDSDLYVFDVEEETLATFETLGYDVNAVDTGFELFVGPDAAGDFFATGVTDDDGGTGFLSLISVILPPADELLGIELPEDVAKDCAVTCDPAPWWWPSFIPWACDLKNDDDVYCGADYFLNVTSFYLNPNFPYELTVDFAEPPQVETEPNDDNASAEDANVGQQWDSAIDPGCDYDVYSFTITEDTFVSIETAGGDTAVQLEDCDTGEVLACDDDSGAGLFSLVEGCLPPGVYCARTRAFSPTDTFAYSIVFNDGGACTADVPPVVSGDGAFTCTDFDTCN